MPPSAMSSSSTAAPVSVGTALPRSDTEAGGLPHPPRRTAQHRRPDSPRPRHHRKHRPRRPLKDQRKGEVTPSSSSSTKWAWTIRPCAASLASPKRPSAPQGTGFCRMGGSRNRWKYVFMVKVHNGTCAYYYRYSVIHKKHYYDFHPLLSR